MMVRLPSFSTMNLPYLKRLGADAGLVLASGSPRRQGILREAGISFEIRVPDFDETVIPGLSPADLATMLAHHKVLSIPGDGVRAYLGCDTIVVYEDMVLNKPVDPADALRMLRILSGRAQSVFTGLCLHDSRKGIFLETVEESRVRFNSLADDQLKDYIATGEPLDKAGAYGIQGMGGILVDSVIGNIDNVVGLPIDALERLAKQYWENYA
jgi:septum formation protein